MSTAYLTTILFNRTEINQIKSTLGSTDFSTYEVVTKTINFLKCLCCLKSSSTKLNSTTLDKFKILIYTNLNIPNTGGLFGLIGYLQSQLETNIDLNDGTTENVLTNLGVNSNQRNVYFWADSRNNTDNIIDNSNTTREEHDFSTDTGENFSYDKSIFVFTNHNFSGVAGTLTKKTSSNFSYGPKTNDRFTNINFVIFNILRNMSSKFDKILYINHEYCIIHEGIHNYLDKLLDQFLFVISPNIHGDKNKHFDLIDSLANNVICYNNSNIGLFSEGKTTLFNNIEDEIRRFLTRDNMNADIRTIRESMTRVSYYLFEKKLSEFNIFFILPISLFGDPAIFDCVMNYTGVIHPEIDNTTLNQKDINNDKHIRECINSFNNSNPSNNSINEFLEYKVNINF